MYTQEQMCQQFLEPLKLAPLYRKNKKVWARPAVIGETITTIVQSGVETAQTVSAPGMVVKNQTKAQEEYFVLEDNFYKLYEFDASALPIGEWSKYTAKGQVNVLKVTKENNPGTFMASWGSMTCEVGDFLVCPVGGSEVYRIAREEFFETYEFVQ